MLNRSSNSSTLNGFGRTRHSNISGPVRVQIRSVPVSILIVRFTYHLRDRHLPLCLHTYQRHVILRDPASLPSIRIVSFFQITLLVAFQFGAQALNLRFGLRALLFRASSGDLLLLGREQ